MMRIIRTWNGAGSLELGGLLEDRQSPSCVMRQPHGLQVQALLAQRQVGLLRVSLPLALVV